MMEQMHQSITIPMRHVELLFDSINRAHMASQVIMHQMTQLESSARHTRDYIQDEQALLEETKQVLRNMLQV